AAIQHCLTALQVIQELVPGRRARLFLEPLDRFVDLIVERDEGKVSRLGSLRATSAFHGHSAGSLVAQCTPVKTLRARPPRRFVERAPRTSDPCPTDPAPA